MRTSIVIAVVAIAGCGSGSTPVTGNAAIGMWKFATGSATKYSNCVQSGSPFASPPDQPLDNTIYTFIKGAIDNEAVLNEESCMLKWMMAGENGTLESNQTCMFKSDFTTNIAFSTGTVGISGTSMTYTANGSVTYTYTNGTPTTTCDQATSGTLMKQ